MADIPMGDAFINVGLKFDQLDADITKAKGKVKAIGDTAISGMAGAGSYGGTTRVAALKEENKQFDEQIKKMHEMLGITEKRDALAQATVGKMGIVDRVMTGLGAKNVGKSGMMGAQLSYAAQDFVTGLSMGNLNMALMGASNNLGMMAMQISSAAAAWTTLGLVSIPLAITGFKYFSGEEETTKKNLEATKEAIDGLGRAFDRMRQSRRLLAAEGDVISDGEISKIHSAQGANDRLEGEKKSLKKLKEEDARILKDRQENEDRRKSKFVAPVDPELWKNSTEFIQNKRDEAAKFRKNGAEILAEESEKQAKEREKQILKSMGLDPDNHAIRIDPNGKASVFSRLSPDVQKKLDEEQKALGDEHKTNEADQKAHEENIGKLKKKRDDEARRELEWQTREADAGENRFQQREIQIQKHKEDETRRIEESGLKDIKLGEMTDEQYNDEKKQIEDTAKALLDKNLKKTQELDRQQKRHGRRGLTDKQLAEDDARIAEIEKNKAIELQKLEDRKNNPATLADPAKDALDRRTRQQHQQNKQDEERRLNRMGVDIATKLNPDAGRNLQIALDLKQKIEDLDKTNLTKDQKREAAKWLGLGAMADLANTGPRTSFSGIAELSKNIQSNISSNPFQQAIQFNTAQTAAAIQSIIQNGLKMIGGGAVP